jgi:N4-gp56 family major capsid protein
MAATSYAVNNPLAVKLWSRKLFHEALKQTTMSRYIGDSSDSMLQFQSDTQKGRGDRITIGLRMQLTGSGTQGDGTLEGNEEALTTYTDNIFIDQLRHAVRSGGKMSDQRIPFSVREEARMGLQDWWADRIDQSSINQLAGVTAQSDTRFTGNQATVAPTAAGGATGTTRILVANSETAETSLSTSTVHQFTLALIDRAVAYAKTAVPLIRPVKANGDNYYLLFLHPFQTYQLRTNTNSGQWLDIQKAAMQGGRIDNNPIFTGALGIYNNVILIENPRMPNTLSAQGGSVAATVANYRRAVFCGAQSAAFAVGQDNSPEKMSWVEELFDYENQLGVSAGMIFGIKKMVFNSVDFGTIVLSSYAPQP